MSSTQGFEKWHDAAGPAGLLEFENQLPVAIVVSAAHQQSRMVQNRRHLRIVSA